ncbi:homocysteine S-methyltransferase family protein [Teichococcus deserti]|uniref:homocysteine S-methyltransferase family protein n=1 Tax=Teichococcus deserti TaxID=1817963 RepID=UPI001A96BAF0|nr:homocysteine S-methyltransferase family protein [Pseudoroseomonas deserti]
MTPEILLLDGGMGRQLSRMGAPFRQPEWSALALMEAPETVLQAHRQFVEAGAEVITTNSYAVVPFHIGEDRFSTDGARLAALSGQLARQAADEAPHKVRVAGSLPPPFGSYRPDLFEPARAPAILKVLVEALRPHVDHWLAETQSAIAEALAAARAVEGTGLPLWISFTLGEETDEQGRPVLRSGELVSDAVAAVQAAGARAILFNCNRPELMGAAVDAAVATLAGADIPVGVYANAFGSPRQKLAQANAGVATIREDLDPPAYGAWAADWARRGARILGGCCGIGPEHLCAIRPALKAEAVPPG